MSATTTPTNTCPPRFYAGDRAGKTQHERDCDNLRIIDSCNRRARWRWAQYVQQPRTDAIPDPTLFRLVREHGETMAASAEAQRAWDDSGNHVISEDEASTRIARAAQIATQIDYEYEAGGDCYEEGDL